MNNHEEKNHSYISHDLDSLAITNDVVDRLEQERDDLIERCVPPEVQARIDDIRDEYDTKLIEPQTAVQELHKLIKENVLEHGATVKGEFLMATWNKGRVSWDTAALKGYAVTHPEVNQLRKTGDPTISIRIIK